MVWEARIVRTTCRLWSALSLILGELTLPLWSIQANGQSAEWPAHPVSVVVGYTAGGNTDVMARIASKALSDKLKQSFVVENRIGAGGAIAANYVAQAMPDGYTLFF